MNQKEPIRLRRRVLRSGFTSLYLDIYLNGVRRYEYLKIYLEPGNSRDAKTRNKERLLLAETVRAQRLVELQNGRFSIKKPSNANIEFFTYYENMILTKKHSLKLLWMANLAHMRRYEHRSKIQLKDIDHTWLLGYQEYLLNKAAIERSSAHAYFCTVKTCLKAAYRDGLIAANPATRISSISYEYAMRMYLTVDEVRKLAASPCDDDVRRAFLFSCLTGIRISDLTRLRWGDVSQQGNYTRIIFQQKKTGGQEYLDISAQAVKYMGERKADDHTVFSFPCRKTIANRLRKWMAEVGISKDITFHCARHTFATMMLDLGADIYTVSKLLGHRELSTTQVYAKILDKNKQRAVDLIPEI